MVKTHAGLSTGPNENLVVSEELKSYLDEQFGSLADKDDIYAMKEDVMALITNMVNPSHAELFPSHCTVTLDNIRKISNISI